MELSPVQTSVLPCEHITLTICVSVSSEQYACVDEDKVPLNDLTRVYIAQLKTLTKHEFLSPFSKLSFIHYDDLCAATHAPKLSFIATQSFRENFQSKLCLIHMCKISTNPKATLSPQLWLHTLPTVELRDASIQCCKITKITFFANEK